MPDRRPWLLYALVGLQLTTLLVGIGIVGKYNQRTIDIHTSAVELCERGNVSRPQTIQTDLDIAKGNRSRAQAYRDQLHTGLTPPVLVPIVKTLAKTNAAEAKHLHDDAAVLANAQHEVALYPDAKSLTKRSIVDCASSVK